MSSKLKIPIGLATAISTSRVHQRAMAVYLQLKQMYSSGRIDNYRGMIAALASECHMSERTFETRIGDLRLVQFVKFEKDGSLQLCPWEKIWTHFNIQFKSKQYWFYDPKKFNFRLEYLLKALAIREKQRHCKSTMLRKLERMREVKEEIKLVLGLPSKAGVKPGELLAGQLKQFRIGCYDDYSAWLLNILNPDLNVSVKYLQGFWGYKESSRSGPSYMKHRLSKLNLITITKRQEESEHRQRDSVSGTVFWSNRERKTKLQLCDDIAFNF